MLIKNIYIFGATSCLVLLNGCSIFRPYVDPQPIPIVTPAGAMPLLEKAIQDIQTTQEKDVRYLRNETQVARMGFGLAAFGAAAATGVSGMYGAGRDLILGLGLGAAGSYTAGNLLFSDIKTKLYNAADNGLGCIADKAHAVSSTINSVVIEKQIIEKSRPANCATTELYNTALINLDLFKAQDATMAHQVRSAGRRILVKLNEELEKNQPSLEIFVSSGIETFALANTFVKKKDSTSKVTAESGQEEDGNCSNHFEQLNEFAKKIDIVINSSVNQFSTIDNCNSILPPIPPLTASQTEINIGKDEEVEIEFSGGKEPLLLEPKWVGTVPATDQIQVKHRGPRKITVSGKSNIPAATSQFSFNVSDTAAIPSTVNITIKPK